MPEALATILRNASSSTPPNPFGHLLDAGNRLGLVRHFTEPELRQVIALWKHDHTAVQKTVLEATQRRLQEYEPTPGPWQTQPIGDGFRLSARIGERLVCIGETHPTRLKNAGPNARRIVAAVYACDRAAIRTEVLQQDPDLIDGLIEAAQQGLAVLDIFLRNGYQTGIDGAPDGLDRGAYAALQEVLAVLGKSHPKWSVSGVLPPAPDEGPANHGEWDIVEQPEQLTGQSEQAENGGPPL